VVITHGFTTEVRSAFSCARLLRLPGRWAEILAYQGVRGALDLVTGVFFDSEVYRSSRLSFTEDTAYFLSRRGGSWASLGTALNR